MFLILESAEQARALLASFPPVAVERVPLAQADGRVLAAPFVTPEPLPPWPRGVMDGYAVRARDTFGASDAVPAFFQVIGAVPMGDVFTGQVGAGQAVAISTGGALPAGADAVVMIEYTQEGQGGELELHRGVAAGDNVLQVGDDVRAGEPLLAAGRRLRPQDIAALAAFGVVEVDVHRRPRVGILSTGNEIVPPSVVPRPGQVRDMNQLAMAAQARRAGADVICAGIARDDTAELHARTTELLATCDAVLLSGGSSVGVRDLTAGVLEAAGATIVFHGISVRPGKPTILARAGDKPILGMPGVPVSAMIIFDMFVRPLLWALGGELRRDPWPARRTARLSRRVPSLAGREDYLRVRLSDDGVRADPILGGSSAVSTVVRADGLVVVPSGVEGLAEGDLVEVLLYD